MQNSGAMKALTLSSDPFPKLEIEPLVVMLSGELPLNRGTDTLRFGLAENFDHDVSPTLGL